MTSERSDERGIYVARQMNRSVKNPKRFSPNKSRYAQNRQRGRFDKRNRTIKKGSRKRSQRRRRIRENGGCQ